MRARDIKPGFYKSDQLAECSMTARLLFPGLWMLADREGRLENRPRKIKAEIFPFDDVDVAPLLVELENAGLIRTYEVNGTALIWIPQFKRHQSPHKNEKSSELAAHPDDLFVTCPVQEQAKDRTTPEKEGTAPVISGQIPLTPSSLTPSSLSPRDNTTPDGVVVDAVPGDDLSAEVGAGNRQASDGERPARGKSCPPCPHQAIVDLYHELLPELSRIKIWDKERQTNMQARWRDRWKAGKYASQQEGLAYWTRFFEYVRDRCPWLMGQVSDRNGKAFRADLGWMILPRNFKKIIEGRYEAIESQDTGDDLLALMEASRQEAREAAERRARENSPWGRVAQ